MSRPLSAHSIASFGQQYARTPNNLELKPKVSNYNSNGSGRDSYIKMSNGGFSKSWNNNYHNSNTLKVSRNDFLKMVPQISKVVVYKTNGSGRDSYIVNSCGGFYRNVSENQKCNWKSGLRDYPIKPRYQNNDYIELSRNYIRKEFVPILKSLSKKQRAHSARLSKPKYIKQ